MRRWLLFFLSSWCVLNGAGLPWGLLAAAESAAYVGAASCRECHPAQFELWTKSPHALAERPLRPELDQRAFEPSQTIKHASQNSVARLHNGQCELVTLGFESNAASYRVERVIGCSPLRQFLTAAPGGRWQTHELAYAPGTKDWFDVYGDEDRRPGEWGHWTGGGMNWNARCAGCHNTHARKNYDSATDAYKTTVAAMGVNCEACHGPLGKHVEWRRLNPNSKAREPFPPLVQRGKTLDTCAACHSRCEDLMGEFQPGDSFYDHYSLEILDEAERWYSDGQVKDEDYEFASFLGSGMFQSGVHCRDCHRSDSGTGNSLCLRCHLATNAAFAGAPQIQPVEHSHHQLGGKGGECVACHLPATVYMQRHSRHDHGFGSPDPLLTKEQGIPNACNRCHKDKSADWSLEYANKWYGVKMQSHARERSRLVAGALSGQEAAKGPVMDMLADQREPAYWRAVAANLLWRWAGETKVEAALMRAMKEEHPLVREKAVLAFESVGGESSARRRTALEEALKDSARCVRVAAAWVLKSSVDVRGEAGRDLLRSLEFNLDQPDKGSTHNYTHFPRVFA